MNTTPPHITSLKPDKRFSWSAIILVIILILIVAILIFLIMEKENQIIGLSPQKLEEERDYATMLQSQGLYRQAIEAYRKYLNISHLEADKRANIHYLIANLYKEKLHNYDEAMAEYIKVKQLTPQSSLLSELNRKIVECLEMMNRSLDAQRTLANTTALKKEDQKKNESVNVVAKIGEKPITLQDLNDEIQKLPPHLQKQYVALQEKLQFLKQYIAKEILYETALRRGYDQDPSIQDNLHRMCRELMIQRLISEEVQDKVTITDAEKQLYYKANQNKYDGKNGNDSGDKKDFTSIKDRIEADLRKEKEQIAYQELIQKALNAQEVQVFDYYFTSEAQPPNPVDP